MAKVADLVISVSLINPAVRDLVKEVQVHRHTAKACRKYGTQCRFNFPKLPIHKTVISTPSNYAFDNEEEKNKKMSRYTKVIDAVKEVLSDDEKMKEICSFKENELNECADTAKIRWRLNQLVENADFQNKDISHVPDDLQHFFHDVIAEDGTVTVSDITIVLDSIPIYDKEESNILKERIEHLLEYADFDISEYKDVSSKLEEYENALSVNKTGYRPFYKRDVSETMVNTYNPEWLIGYLLGMEIWIYNCA